MKLTGIDIANYRSIGSTIVQINPLRKCNILIGRNNVGKSNVMRAIRVALASAVMLAGQTATGKANAQFLADDTHFKQGDLPMLFTLRFEATQDPRDHELVSYVGDKFEFQFRKSAGEVGATIVDHTFAHMTDRHRANNFYRAIMNKGWTSVPSIETLQRAFLEDASWLFNNRFQSALPQRMFTVPEFRQISKAAGEYDPSGTNLTQLLHQYQHPPEGREADYQKFLKIEGFVRQLLHEPHARLEVDARGENILLTTHELRRNITYYGTGVHELIILITAVLSVEDALCYIEEPEIHLHPTLQREFLKFIVTQTNNTYFLSTHSATFINAHTRIDGASTDVQVFHLRRPDKATTGGPILQDEHSLVALADIGVTASDILQANCLIWVEGPSDRIYINHWLQLIDPTLVEGLHYSILHYGGRLLSHLSADRDAAASELIDILRINQRAIVVMDSDRKPTQPNVNATKQRVKEESEASGGIGWITDGREIENYLPASVIEATYLAATGQAMRIQFNSLDKLEEVLENALAQANLPVWRYANDKVGYARQFIQHFSGTEMDQHLRTWIERIVGKISYWNRAEE